MNSKVIHDEAARRFEIRTEGYTAHLSYIIRGKIMDIVHTFVPEQLRGRGIAAALVEAAYEYALEEGYSFQATCPYARTWINRNI